MAADRIHVAGVLDLAEAELLVACGYRAIGFPLVLAHHREDLGAEAAASIVEALGDRARCFLITYLDRAVDIAALCGQLGVDLVQLHGEIAVGELRRLRAGWPGIELIKSLIVRGDNLVALSREVQRYAPFVDAFITDTFDPATGACGATGRTHDWQVSRALVARSPRPVILAGGLTPDNVGEAIRLVQPAGVDVHTGVEGADGRKQADLCRRFLNEASRGLAQQAAQSSHTD